MRGVLSERSGMQDSMLPRQCSIRKVDGLEGDGDVITRMETGGSSDCAIVVN